MANQELHVIFGTGPVGQAVSRELVKRGKTVKMFNRSGNKPGGVPEGVAVVAGDVFDANGTEATRPAAPHRTANAQRVHVSIVPLMAG